MIRDPLRFLFNDGPIRVAIRVDDHEPISGKGILNSKGDGVILPDNWTFIITRQVRMGSELVAKITNTSGTPETYRFGLSGSNAAIDKLYCFWFSG